MNGQMPNKIPGVPESAGKPDRLRMGDALAEIGRRAGLEDGDLIFDRNSDAAEPIEMSPAGFDVFLAALDTPAEPVTAMVETLRRVVPRDDDASDQT